MVAATLCGITDPKKVKRSICAMGHKWLWNAALGGLPPEQFLVKVDPLLAGVREKLDGQLRDFRSDRRNSFGSLGQQLGLKAGIPVPVGAFDAHWDAIGAGCRTDDMVNVVGTSTCIIGITPSVNLVPGVCGVVQGSVHPQRTGIEAGLSAVGDIFNAIATRAGTDVPDTQPRTWGIIGRANRAASPYLGQRGPDCPRQSEPARRYARLEPAEHGTG